MRKKKEFVPTQVDESTTLSTDEKVVFEILPLHLDLGRADLNMVVGKIEELRVVINELLKKVS